MIEYKSSLEEMSVSDLGCLFIEHKNEMKPIYFFKATLWFKLTEINKIQVHSFYESIKEEEDYENMYILKVEDNEMPIVPVHKDIVEKMIVGGHLVEDINVDDFVEKYHDQYSHITKEYMEDALIIIKSELKRMMFDLKYDEYKNDNLDDVSEDLSLCSFGSSSELGESDK